jgi:hypothetical protein
MKNFNKALGSQFTYMSDGIQEFDACVVNAMDSIRLWDCMRLSHKLSHNGINYFISIGDNGRYFKTDGQKYSTHLHIQKGDKCYLEGCLCSWVQSEFTEDVLFYKEKIEGFIANGIDFDAKFSFAEKHYPSQIGKG